MSTYKFRSIEIIYSINITYTYYYSEGYKSVGPNKNGQCVGIKIVTRYMIPTTINIRGKKKKKHDSVTACCRTIVSSFREDV